MSNNPLISVIMCSYNQDEFIEESIVSIIEQNYSNLEFIINDGGSSDNTVDIIKKYSKYISKWRSYKDDGQTSALIDGFNHATGDIMGWINSDDLLMPNTLNLIADEYKKDSTIGIFYGNYFYIDSLGKIIGCKRVPSIGVKYFADRGNWIFGSTATFFNRLNYTNCGGLNKDLFYVMDADLYMRMILNGVKYKYINYYVGAFRRHDDAKTVYGKNESRKEYNSIAKKNWSNNARQGRSKKKWMILYKILQFTNGNIIMFIESMYYRGKHWKEMRGR